MYGDEEKKLSLEHLKKEDLGALVVKVAISNSPELRELPSQFEIPALIQNKFKEILRLTIDKPLTPQQARERINASVHPDNPYYKQMLDLINRLEQQGQLVRTEWGLLIFSDSNGDLGTTEPEQGLPESISHGSLDIKEGDQTGLSIHSHTSPKPPSFGDAYGMVYYPRQDNPSIMTTVDEEDFWILVRTKESQVSKSMNMNKWQHTEPKEEQIRKLTSYTNHNKLALFQGSSKDFSRAQRVI